MKKFLASLLFALLALTGAYAQNATPLPVPVQNPTVTDFGNGPLKFRVVQTYAYVFTSQGSGTGSTAGSSTALTLTSTPTTPPIVGAYITGNGITAGTTVAAYNGTTGITLSAAMTVPGGTALSWGAACPNTVPPAAQYIQASVMSDFWPLYTRARVCGASPGGPVGSLLILPYDTATSSGGTPSGPAGGVLSGTYPNPGMAAGAIVNADINASAAIALSKLASQSANTVLGALTATTPSALAIPDTTGAANALGWTAGVGFGVKTIPSTPPGGSSGQIQYNNSGAFGGFTASGDFTINTGTGVGTLATVNANVGSFGSATQCVAFTTNGKGLITAASAATCTPGIASVTGLGTGVATALGVNVGSAGAFVTFNGALGTPSSGTATNLTGLPISTGVTGLGTGVAGSLAINAATAGGFTTNISATGATALSTAAIASTACFTTTAAATGTATTDVVIANFNSDPTATTGYAPLTTGGLSIYVFPSLNQVNFRVCNPTASSITPGAITLNWKVIR